MPIATCFVMPDISIPLADLIDTWAELSGIDSSYMTCNVVHIESQIGNPYKIIAQLYLPTLWKPGKAADIQSSLAKALCQLLEIGQAEVIVMTQMIESGLVFEEGETQTW